MKHLLLAAVGALCATQAGAADLPHRDYGDADPPPQPPERHQRWDDFADPAAPTVIEEWIIHRRRTGPAPATATERRDTGCADIRPVPPPIGPLLSPADAAALRGGRRHD